MKVHKDNSFCMDSLWHGDMEQSHCYTLLYLCWYWHSYAKSPLIYTVMLSFFHLKHVKDVKTGSVTDLLPLLPLNSCNRVFTVCCLGETLIEQQQKRTSSCSSWLTSEVLRRWAGNRHICRADSPHVGSPEAPLALTWCTVTGQRQTSAGPCQSPESRL